MLREVKTSVIAIVALTLVFGLAYPLATTGVSQVIFPGKSDGSKVKSHGKVVGSKLIGQDFRIQATKNGKPQTDKDGNPVMVPLKRYFQPRPSTSTSYAADASAFTNLGPNSADARDTFKANLESYLQLERPFNRGLTATQVPIDAVTSSASGVDPHISQANAAIQAHRIAAVRQLPLATVQKLIKEKTAGRSLGIFGEPGVNVLELNLALDALKR
ncbi:MAG TPA: potassium-transporting ATPase subunit C [Thermoleophilaceae bacterium]|jgi:K+-transporting ATPase ATPase C chain